jgi:hypothetical protein
VVFGGTVAWPEMPAMRQEGIWRCHTSPIGVDRSHRGDRGWLVRPGPALFSRRAAVGWVALWQTQMRGVTMMGLLKGNPSYGSARNMDDSWPDAVRRRSSKLGRLAASGIGTRAIVRYRRQNLSHWLNWL